MTTSMSWDEVLFYDPSQPRGDNGRWTKGGGGGSGSSGGGGKSTKTGWKRTSTPEQRKKARESSVNELVTKYGEGFRANAERQTEWMTEFTPEEATARRDRLAEFTRASYGKTDTQTANTAIVDGKREPGQYTPERLAAHTALIEDYKKNVAGWDGVPTDRKALLSGGLGGAGKGTMLDAMNIDHKQFITIDPDGLKGLMVKRGLVPDPVSLGLKDFDPPVRPMELAGLMHEESSDLSKQITKHALAEGKNVILDNTMGSDSVFRKVDELKANGYEVEGVFVDVSVDMSVESALARHMNGTVRGGMGGRFVDPGIAAGQKASDPQYRSANRERFDKIAPTLKSSVVIDNEAYAQRPSAIHANEWGKLSQRQKSYVMQNIRGRKVGEVLSTAKVMTT